MQPECEVMREREGGSSGGEFQAQVPVDEALPTTYQVPVDEAIVLEVVHGGTDLESHVQDDLVLLCQLLPIANELQQTTWTQHRDTQWWWVWNTAQWYMYTHSGGGCGTQHRGSGSSVGHTT